FFGNEEVPFNVALLLDVSPSVSNSLDDIHEAAIAFVRQLRAEDRIMIVAFDRNVRFLTDFTNDRYVLERAIENTRTGNGTSVYEAVYDTVANRLRHVQGRKALILLSDGEDTTSRSVGYDETINIVTESDVLVYGLRFPDSGGYGQGPWSYPRNRLPWPIPNPRNPFPFPWPHFGPLDPPADPGASVAAANGGSGQATAAVAAVAAGMAETSWPMLPRQAAARSTMPRVSMTCLDSLARLRTSFATCTSQATTQPILFPM